MATAFCTLCDRHVPSKRKIGIGTLILCFFTAFFWVLVIPFYGKKCPICGNADLLSQKQVQKLKELDNN